MQRDLPELPLANIELEQALLGSILADPYHLSRISNLRPEHYYEPVHQRIFSTIIKVAAAGETPSTLTIRHRFDGDHALRDIGGGAYLGKLAAASLIVLDAKDCERQIISLWRSRKLREAWAEGLSSLESITAEEAAASVNTATHNILADADACEIRTDYDVAVEILEDMKKETSPVSTGIKQLDVTMGGGLYPGMAYGFAARKKIGKTIMASTIACNLNLAGVPHLFICGEMSAKEVHQRTLARLANQFPSNFRTRQKDDFFQQAIADAAVRSPRLTFYLDAPGISFDHLRRACASAVATKGIKGIILDYWQLVSGKQQKQSTTEHLDSVAQWIADFCRKHQIWAIVMAQINQEGNTRGGEGIRLAFDQVYQIHAMPGSDGIPNLENPGRWLQMLDTRYTAWGDVGTEITPAIVINNKGPYFEEVGT